MMLAAMVLITFNVVFWTLFEQAGSSLTLFADRNTDLHVTAGFAISAGQTQFFNAFFIVALAPLFSMMWNSMAQRGVEPTIPVKFGLALMGVGPAYVRFALRHPSEFRFMYGTTPASSAMATSRRAYPGPESGRCRSRIP